MSTAAETYKVTSRLERVVRQPLDAPGVESIRKGIKLLLALNTESGGQFIVRLLQDGFGREVSKAAWQSVDRGILVGDDLRVPVGAFCLGVSGLAALRPLALAGPPPVAPEPVLQVSRARWLRYLSLEKGERELDDPLFSQGLASRAAATPLPTEQVTAAFQLAYDVDPSHTEVRTLADAGGDHGALARQFLLRMQLQTTATRQVEAPRRRNRAV